MRPQINLQHTSLKMSLLTLVAAAALASACAEADPTVRWEGTVGDSAGIRVVHNPEEGIWGPGEGWRFSHSFTIGADVGDPNYEFGRVTSIQVSPDGLIFVFDKMASEIRVFNQQGSHIRTMGRRGEGPGEFSQGAAGMFLMGGDRLAIPDMGNQRITWLSLQGELLGTARVSYSSGFPVAWGGDRQEGIYVQRRAMGFNEDPDLEEGDPLVRIGPDGSEETLVIMPKAETVWMEGAAARFRYFATEPSWDMGPSGTLRTGMTQHYRIESRRPDGSIHSIVTKASPPRPVTDQDLDRFIHLMRDALERMDLSPAAVNRQIDNLSFGTTFPAFNRVMEGPGETTLVQQIEDLDNMDALDLSQEMSRRLGASTWDAFDPEGRYLGTIHLPHRFTPMVWEPDAVYGRWLDDLDRAHMQKLDMVRGAR